VTKSSSHPLHSRLVRHVRLRPRLLASAFLGLLLVAILVPATEWRLSTCLIVAWDVATTLYLGLAWSMMLRSTPDRMRIRARLQDDGAWAALFLSILAAVASLAAIVVELATVKDIGPTYRGLHILAASYTIITAWLFIHTTFALHYANEYFLQYLDCRNPGLDIPGGGDPDYWEFMYFSFVIGTSGQTADICMTSNRMRRIGLLHCVLAFLFNTTILALTINIGAGLF